MRVVVNMVVSMFMMNSVGLLGVLDPKDPFFQVDQDKVDMTAVTISYLDTRLYPDHYFDFARRNLYQPIIHQGAECRGEEELPQQALLLHLPLPKVSY